ncbi:phosphohydrolase [Aliidiomarina taiwanensis]|uniref:Phosphohydrolase n=2 Tax=Aliidiomarina taiwanensis TaxID=946228 RepID=A0A432X058_9GAMM|nr:phosphohydrolase [Aliidiomarina taiwanensis]
MVQRVQRLNAIGIALSSEQDANVLLEDILSGARELTNADAGTLYIVEGAGPLASKHLRFALVQNDTLNIHYGGTGKPVGKTFSEIPLYLDEQPNERMVAAFSVLHNKAVSITDAYQEEGFDFQGTREFDKQTGYRSQSMLVIPLNNHDNEIIAAIQLLNKKDKAGNTIPFNDEDMELLSSLASQAAVALSNRQLIDDLHKLFESFTHVIATAIDAKSPQTGAHCRRVPDATLMLAQAASGSQYPGIEKFKMSKSDMYALEIAAWLHDCGKIVTPPHIVEKSTKLETISDRIALIEARIEVLLRQERIARLEAELAALKPGAVQSTEVETLQQKEAFWQQVLTFLRATNKGGEFLADEDIERLNTLSRYSYITLEGDEQPLITEDELENLSVRRGTLTDAERQIMNDHMVHTIQMLEKLPFPKHLKNVPEYAGGHHERMDGTGYPKGLRREEMSVPARIMGIADVFEALTAPERSYKQPMSLSQTLTIMGRMVENKHLDPDLFNLFVEKKVYLQYAEKHLQPEQIDQVDLSQLPGLSLRHA